MNPTIIIADDHPLVLKGLKDFLIEKNFNIIASKSCPTIPSNVCTIVDLANIIAKAGTYSECFEIAADSWVITHNLGRYPSVTVVDNNNKVVVGDIQYNNTNTITISFDKAFVGCAFLN